MVAGWSLLYLQQRLIPPFFIGEFSFADLDLVFFIAFSLGM
jgi:hypothetical protein